MNMDALASQKFVFENSYMYPTSSPSRAALFACKQSIRTDVYTVPAIETGTAKKIFFLDGLLIILPHLSTCLV